MAFIPYTLVPAGDGWCLSARGFTWHFSSRQKAVAFALTTAREFAQATGQATSVRVQGDDGGMRELRGFGGPVRPVVDPLLSVFRATTPRGPRGREPARFCGSGASRDACASNLSPLASACPRERFAACAAPTAPRPSFYAACFVNPATRSSNDIGRAYSQP